eukprot:UN14291
MPRMTSKFKVSSEIPKTQLSWTTDSVLLQVTGLTTHGRLTSPRDLLMTLFKLIPNL